MNIEKDIRIVKWVVLLIALGFAVVCSVVLTFGYFAYSVQDEMFSSVCVDEATFRDTVDGLIEESKLDEAVSLSIKYVEQTPKDHQGYYYLGLAYYLKGDWSNAITNLDKAAEIEPEWQSRWINPYRDSARLNLAGKGNT